MDNPTVVGTCQTCERVDCTFPKARKNHPEYGCYDWQTAETTILISNTPRFDDVFRPKPQLDLF